MSIGNLLHIRLKLRTSIAGCVVFLAGIQPAYSQSAESGPYFATGIKIGEVRPSSAIVWTRLTRTPERVDSQGPLPIVQYRDGRTGEIYSNRRGRRNDEPTVSFPAGHSVQTLEGAAPGTPGDVRVRYRVEGTSDWTETAWRPVEPYADYTRSFILENLSPSTCYEVAVEGRHPGADEATAQFAGRFCTAPGEADEARVRFTVSTGQAYEDVDHPDAGYKIYGSMLARHPDFFVHTGDILYYDEFAKTRDLALWHWQRMYSLPTNVTFHRSVPAYFIKDDHDTWVNDCWPGMEARQMGAFTFAQGLEIFPQQVPMSEKTYRRFRWGRDLEIWLVEGRDYRSPNTMRDGPEKTIWGEEQKAWFKRTVAESDATFRVLISPTPMVGPDRENKRDNHCNDAFAHEGRELREFISEQENMYVVCGDRHWQYVSVARDFPVREYSCGPASDAHAGGWSQNDVRPEHEYLNVTGGFLEIEVRRVDGNPTLFARHFGVDGDLLHVDARVAE